MAEAPPRSRRAKPMARPTTGHGTPSPTDLTITTTAGVRANLPAEHLAVMRLILRGCTYRQIGRMLYMSRPTICARVRDVKNWLGVATRTEALVILIHAGVDTMVQDTIEPDWYNDD